jgi:endonuclease/exonuclease/phosphatase family metal-dependent hydrolase
MTGAPVRVMSWNIHGAVGLDGHHDLDRVVAIIERLDPDILSLQEVDTRGRAAGERPVERLVEAFGHTVAEATTVRSPDGDYGHVLVSRWPLQAVRTHDISVRRREPRAAIEATVASPAGPLHVLSVHFGLNVWERRRQARLLRALAAASDAPFGLALGDFNDWAWPGPVERALAAVYPDLAAHRSFPARMPLFKLDRLYARPAGILVRSQVDTGGRLASDHLPLVVDLSLPAGNQARPRA